MKFMAGFSTALVLLCLLIFALVYTGVYNVAASEDHTGIEKWLLATAMTNSVKAHAREISPPPRFNDEAENRGYRLFDDMCVQCHGAPGKKRGEVGVGLRPEPPSLSDTARRWNAAELFWIISHGIKATGMPAFARTHTESQLWDIVAFVQKLSDLSARQYDQLSEKVRPNGSTHEHDGHIHEHGSEEH